VALKLPPDCPIQWAEMTTRESLESELAEATAELRAHLASWEYAFSMAGGCQGGREHPHHWATQSRTEALTTRCRNLRARLLEHQL
jgi:hypothetical protein